MKLGSIRASFHRITTSGRWIPEIDGLRCVAILAVLLVHILDQTAFHGAHPELVARAHPGFLASMNRLGRGVELFFVLSGFILSQPFLRHFVEGARPVSLKAFYLRRVTRLEPPYLLSLLLYGAALVTFRSVQAKAVLPGLLAHLFYVHNFFRGLLNLNPPSWTLEVEIQFYLVAPLLAMLYLVRPAWLRRTIFVLLITGFAGTRHARMEGLGFYLPTLLGFFLTGYLLADLRIHQRSDWFHPGWDLLNLAVWPVFFFLLPDYATTLPMCILLSVAIAAAMLGPSTRRLIGAEWVAITGGMCYSLYLTHMLLISALYTLTRRAQVFHSFYLNYAAEVMLLLPLILLGGSIFFMLVERPCMDPDWPAKAVRWLGKARRSQGMHDPASSTHR